MTYPHATGGITSHYEPFRDEAEEDCSNNASRTLYSGSSSRGKSSLCALSLLFMLVCMGVIASSQNFQLLLHEFLETCLVLGWKASPVVACVTAILIVCCLGVVLNPLFVGVGILFVKMYGEEAGPVIGVLSECIGVWIGCLLAFIIGRTLLKPQVESRMSKLEWAKTMNRVVEMEGAKFVFLAFSTPVTPTSSIYFISLTSISFGDFAVGACGNFAPTGFVVYCAGSAFAAASRTGHSSRDSIEFWLTCAFNLAIVVGMVLLLVLSTRKYKMAIEAEKLSLES